ncbi:MAG: HAD family hydrolase, partial [Nanoarchaeota archaeon]
GINNYKQFLKRYGIRNDIDIDNIRANIFDTKVWKNIDEAVWMYINKIGVKRNIDEFFFKFKDYAIRHHHHIRYYRETKYVLNKLRKFGWKIAFITNWDQHARGDFELIGLSRYADHMLISSEHGKRKPHPSLYKRVLKIFKVKPSEALMVGDSYERDYLAPLKFGMHALWLNRKGHKKESVKQIRNLKEVIKYVNNI